jgi:hypothetical protein
MAAIGGCQAVSTAIGAPPPQGATPQELQAIQDAFNNTSDLSTREPPHACGPSSTHPRLQRTPKRCRSSRDGASATGSRPSVESGTQEIGTTYSIVVFATRLTLGTAR